MAIDYEDEVPDGYTLATDDDFEWVESSRKDAYYAKNEEGKGYYHYVGDAEYVMVPHKINDHVVRRTLFMFSGITSNLKGVAMSSPFINDVRYTFYQTRLSTLSLDHYDVSNVQIIHGLFEKARFDYLDLSSFDTSKASKMAVIFLGARIGELNLEGWNTSNANSFSGFFRLARIDSVDLTSFDFSESMDLKSFFRDSEINTVYVKSQKDMMLLTQEITLVPDGLEFIIKDKTPN